MIVDTQTETVFTERPCTFDTLERYIANYIINNASHYATLNKFELERIKLLVKILNLKKRNKPLAKYLFLKHSGAFVTPKQPHGEYDPKRGRDNKGVPAKYIMEVLGCPRRTAIDYRNALIADEKGDILWDILTARGS